MIALLSDLAPGELAVWLVLIAATAALWWVCRDQLAATWREAGRREEQ